MACGNCNFQEFFDGACDVLGAATNTSVKPEALSVPAAPAGPYTLLIGNRGPGDEGYRWTVVVTPDGAAGSGN